MTLAVKVALNPNATNQPKLMKLGQNVCLDEIWNESENGSSGFKNYDSRSNLCKHYVHSRGLTFGSIPMKLGQNGFLSEILDKFEIGSCGVNN